MILAKGIVLRSVFLLGTFLCLTNVARADSITISTTFPTATLGGLSGTLAGGILLQTVNLTVNVPATVSYRQFTGFVATPPFSGGGVSTNVTQTITVNGVSVDVVRTLSLLLVSSLGGTPVCPNDTILRASAATATIDLGSTGKVDVALRQTSQAGELGFPPSCVQGAGIIIVPDTTATVLLRDVPPPSTPVPEPSSVILCGAGLAGAVLYEAKRRLARWK